MEHASLQGRRQAIRDTKDPDRRITLHFDPATWRRFMDAQKARFS
ncbi:DUF397 domain-containing protein [Streptomyces sp. AV19]|nr:DUF397 domain-containing protein [Streptomyces sp. AV19]